VNEKQLKSLTIKDSKMNQLFSIIGKKQTMNKGKRSVWE
jgi:hypothetical protein